MNVTPNVLLLLAGLSLLVFAANWLIQGCVRLSSLLKLSPFFIGVVLIAFGTSVPEVGVGVMSALRGQSIIALGDVLGSNIANIGLVIGLCALLLPVDIVNKNIFKKEMLLMLISVPLLFVLTLDLVISRFDALILLLLFGVFCTVSYRGASESYDEKELEGFEFKKLLKNANSKFSSLVIVISLAGVVLGANLMLKGGINLATIFGINPWLVAITVFAVGTSLPELAASIVASTKKIHSIGVGTIVGSNVFNILFVLGIVSLIQPIVLPASILKFELLAVFLFSLALLIVMKTEYKVTRPEGLFLFLSYIGFIILLILRT